MFIVRRRYVFRGLVPALVIISLLFPPVSLLQPLLPLSGTLAHAATLPERPRVFLDTTYALPAGRTTNVPAGGDLQAAFNNAAPGDVIVLQAGATFTGNYVAPNKTGTGWIYVISSALSSLPAPGNRVSPTHAGLMPKIVTDNQSPALRVDFGAHHWRFAGIEFATTWTSRSATQWTIVSMGTQATSLSQLPHHVVFDRVFVHGTSTGDVRVGITLNAATAAVIDSYFNEIHEDGTQEAQAVWVNNGIGPFKIANNHLEAAGQNLMFGGWDPTIANLVPTDIEIRGNHFFKPLSWRQGDPSYAGIPWVIKPLLELKNARRVLIEGNVFQQKWEWSAYRWAVMFTPRNDAGTAPWSTVEDVTFTNNIIHRATGGIQILGWDYMQPSEQAKRILVRNNLFIDIGIYPSAEPFWTGTLLWMEDGAADVTIDHNTAFNTGHPLVASARSGRNTATGFVYTNNIVLPGSMNVLNLLNTYFPGWTLTRNAVPGANASWYPAGNEFPASLSLVGFVDLAGGNYQLGPLSPYLNAGTDGKDIGVDYGALIAATATAISGVGSADNTPPTVLLTAPSSGEVSDIVTVSANAIDNVGVAGVQFKVNASNLGPEDTTNAYAVDWDTTKVANGTYTLTATARDGTGNTTTSAPVTVAVNNPDTTAPIISSVSVSSVASSSASITWTTNEPSDSQVEYGLTTSYGSVTPLDTAKMTAHAVALSGLTGGTTYHYRVKSRDAAGNLTASADFTFTTILPLSVAPTSLAFGSVAVGTPSGEQNVRVSNTSAVGVSLTGVTVTGPFAISRNYCQANGSWNGVIAPGTKCDLYVVFAPVADGAATGTLSVSALGNVYPVALAGTGATPSVSVAPTGLAFGSVAVGTPSGEQNVRVSNTSAVGVSLTSVTVTGPFAISRNYCQANGSWNGVIAPGTKCDLYVVFAPVADGAATGTLSIGALGNGYPVALAGSGTAPVQSPFKGTPFSVPGQIEAEDFDNGGEGLAYHDNVSGNAGGVYRTNVDVDIRRTPDGGVVVFNFEIGEWLEYTINVTQTGTYRLDLLVSSEFTTGRWSASIDGVPVTGSVAVPQTGSWATFKWVGVDGIGLIAGQHVIRIAADQQYFDFAALRLTQVSSRAPFKGTPASVPGQIEAEDFDWGGEGVAYHDLVAGNAGGQYRLNEDVDIFLLANGANVVRNLETGEWLEYTINVTQAGTYRLELLVSSASFVISRWHAKIDGVPVTGSVAVPNAGWSTFQWVGVDGIALTAGQHVLRIVADQQYFDFAALRLTQVSP